MAKRPLLLALALLCAFSLSLKGQSNQPNPGPWSGIIINANCTSDDAFAELPKCTDKEVTGAKILYDDTSRQLYNLDPPDQAAGHLGDSVTVSGTLDGNTIRNASVKPLVVIGLAVGQKAPAFSLRDQFGREQTLDTLKGPKGTVLLFFRSADW